MTAPSHSFRSPLAAAPQAAASSTDALVGLLQRQRDLYSQLEQLSRQQAELIAEGEAEQLLTLLSQRQRLIDQLSELNVELTPYRSRWQQVFAALSPQRQQEVGQLVREVEAQLASIIEQDEKDRTQLRQAQQQVGGELKRMSQATAARQAYGPGTTGGPRFTSQQG